TPPNTPHTPAEKSKKPADAKKPTPPAKPAAPSKPSIDEPAEPAEPVTVPESIKPAPIVPPAKAKPARAPAWPAHLPKGAMSATDYPEPMSVARVNELSLLLIKSAFPAPLANGQARMSVWPQRLALDPWPRYVAWLAAMTELICGLLVLAGFFTRMSSALLSLTMLTAMWLTQIGPAVASGDAVLGILPNRTWWEPAQWATLLWQLAIVCMCLALVAAGPGWLSLDRFFTAAGTKPKKTAPEPDDE
ncbi:DoxX family protein, partial [Synechococcus sp. Cruz CV-v-12]|uniref:DoxX family protein n=1 Tax=Synechococcus sp. Cruz CV-v-12 TaxID=2823728 RepID=UPI0020CC2630